ncbi:MAG: hypothetical protein DLM57_07120 [Pseudonocardiales bacterium]|nr:MAG: hypothetical protein DLM57_07120 [Pseudonocardiales bacterium]
MPHALVMQVKLLDGGESEEGMRILKEMVVPQAKSQAGFQRGTWMNHGGDGMGVVVFDSAEHAQAAQEDLKPPPGGPELVSSVIYEVGAEA